MASLPLKWHGGKHYLADRIIELMPPHVHYVEPYFGGGSVLFRKSCDGISEVANDLNSDLWNFWHVLKNESTYESFKRVVEATPFSEKEFDDSFTDRSASPPVWRALAFFVRYRQSRQGLGKDFATLSRNRTRRGMNEQVSSWLSAIEGLPEAHERLKRVVILNQDALDVIRSQDGAGTLFYLDPPYVHETRTVADAYEHEMTLQQHAQLLVLLETLKGKFVLSGYHSQLYDQSQKDNNWRCVEVQIDNKSSGAKTKEIKTECLWMNFT